MLPKASGQCEGRSFPRNISKWLIQDPQSLETAPLSMTIRNAHVRWVRAGGVRLGIFFITHLTRPHPQPFSRRGRESPLPSGEG